jgi:hypothetical protein
LVETLSSELRREERHRQVVEKQPADAIGGWIARESKT